MFSHPDRIGQLASENHRQMMAQASLRQLGRKHGQQATRTSTGVGRIIRRVATTIGGAGTAAAQRLRPAS